MSWYGASRRLFGGLGGRRFWGQRVGMLLGSFGVGGRKGLGMAF